jgi:lipopolysaccharide biosynthesis glycosyltransferase
MKRNVVFTAADHNYVVQACVLAKSLAETQIEPTIFYVLGNDWSKRDSERLSRLSTGSFIAEVKPFVEARSATIKLSHDFPVETAFNVLAPCSVFSDETRILYLDADMLVRKDLSNLFKMPMKTPVAAVCDAHISVVGIPSMWRPWREEAVDPLVAYLNTGTMLIDVVAWNRQNMTEAVIDLLRAYAMPCVDQDALNLVLRGQFDRLPPTYNSMPYHYFKLLRNADLVESADDLRVAMNDPAIIHFHRSFFGKPWNLGCWHPWVKAWREHARQIKRFQVRGLAVRDNFRGIAARVVGMAAIDAGASRNPTKSLK